MTMADYSPDEKDENAHGSTPPPSYVSATAAINSQTAETARKHSSRSQNSLPSSPPPPLPPRHPDLLKTYGDSPNYETKSKISNVSCPTSFQVSPSHGDSANYQAKSKLSSVSRPTSFQASPSQVRGEPSSLMNLNISGTKFAIPKKSLLRHPTTFLGAIAGITNKEVAYTQCDVYIPDIDEYYFERSPQIFEQVLGFYRHGTFHVPDVCPDEFLTEILYWRLRPEFVADCCKDRIPSFLWQYHKTSQIHKLSTHPIGRKRVRDPFSNKLFGAVRKRLWRVLVKPWQTRQSKVFSCLAILFIFLTLFCVTIHSYTQYQMPIRPHDHPLNPNNQSTTTPPVSGDENTTGITENDLMDSSQMTSYRVVNALYFTCIIFITLEYALRLFAAPYRVKFMKTHLAILDQICIVMYFVGIFVYVSARNGSISKNWFLLIQAFQVLQIFRIARYSAEIRLLFYALKKAAHQIFLLCLIIGIVVVFFGSLIYIVELWNSNTEITSIPLAIYWAFITVTTVGYGDISPVSPGGRVVAMIATLSGVIIMGFPISLVVSQFSDTYETEMDHKRRKREIIDMVHTRDASMYSAAGTPVMPPARTAFQAGGGGGSRRKSHFAGALGRQMFIVRRHGESSEGGGAGANGGVSPGPGTGGTMRRRMSTDAIQRLAVSRMSSGDINVIPKDAFDGILNEAFSEVDMRGSFSSSDGFYDEEADDEAFEAPRTSLGPDAENGSRGRERY